MATLSQLSAFSPGDKGAEAELPAACVHPAVTDILGSFATGARNNPFPPPASLWVAMDRLGWAQHWLAFLLWGSVQLSTTVASWGLQDSPPENQERIQLQWVLVCLSQLCRWGPTAELLLVAKGRSFHFHWGLSQLCSWSSVQCTVSQIHCTGCHKLQVIPTFFFFYNLKSLTLKFEIISNQCCQENSEALGPVFISQYQTISRKSHKNICALLFLKRLPKGVNSEKKQFRSLHR